ncbi:uncharacterized protein BO95DRAFT_217627 [Aspergillus brunneoviolaceus CBS 621.78]|uniref:Uncharacterized protein n=1 Tax=Aspergillus brunneoviolaceus CBS 621.78 TaxID=1450534 RepID=A0ACD1G162_9EURO|nr:hypothetical protein BO95DRAFT_217627 [Aspergillus brunneoviolaceus CBS 621.78]RAH42950.1 hypothetical protein BO95DRAFT_217627 [Aspergillus brunneoviolaceus CBS 621.78]
MPVWSSVSGAVPYHPYYFRSLSLLTTLILTFHLRPASGKADGGEKSRTTLNFFPFSFSASPCVVGASARRRSNQQFHREMFEYLWVSSEAHSKFVGYILSLSLCGPYDAHNC